MPCLLHFCLQWKTIASIFFCLIMNRIPFIYSIWAQKRYWNSKWTAEEISKSVSSKWNDLNQIEHTFAIQGIISFDIHLTSSCYLSSSVIFASSKTLPITNNMSHCLIKGQKHKRKLIQNHKQWLKWSETETLKGEYNWNVCSYGQTIGTL